MSFNKPILGYWDMRGIVQPIRLLLSYAGVDFIDRRYSFQDNGSEWFKEKFTLGLDFPNLPYYIDDNVKLTHSLAILQYLARSHALDGKTSTEKARIYLAEQQITDLNQTWWNLITAEDYIALKAAYLKELPAQLELISSFLGTRPFIAGTAVSYVDFLLYEYLLRIYSYAEDVLAGFVNLYKFVERIESLPRLSAYIKTSRPSGFVPVGYNWYGEY